MVVEATSLPVDKPDSGGHIHITEEEINALYVCPSCHSQTGAR